MPGSHSLAVIALATARLRQLGQRCSLSRGMLGLLGQHQAVTGPALAWWILLFFGRNFTWLDEFFVVVADLNVMLDLILHIFLGLGWLLIRCFNDLLDFLRVRCHVWRFHSDF